MAAGRIVLPSYFPARDRNARLVSGALLTVYVDNTTTKAEIYSDIALTTAMANPVEANSSGQFPAIFCDAGTVEVPILYGLGVSGPDGASIGNPAIFYGWQPSVDGETAMAALASQASEAAQAYYEDIVALEGIADDAIALATRAAKSANLSDLTDPAAARTNIGAVSTSDLGTLAVKSANLSDLADATAARTNIGAASVVSLPDSFSLTPFIATGLDADGDSFFEQPNVHTAGNSIAYKFGINLGLSAGDISINAASGRTSADGQAALFARDVSATRVGLNGFGHNDAQFIGAVPQDRRKFADVLRQLVASHAWKGIPTGANKVRANGSGILEAGTWADSANFTGGRVSTTNGSVISKTLTNVRWVIVWKEVRNGSGGRANIVINDTVQGEVAFAPASGSVLTNGSTTFAVHAEYYDLGRVVESVLVQVIVTSATNAGNPVPVVGIAGLDGSQMAGPVLAVCDLSDRGEDGYATGTGSLQAVPIISRLNTLAAAICARMGMRVLDMPLSKYLPVSTALTGDELHPSESGATSGASSMETRFDNGSTIVGARPDMMAAAEAMGSTAAGLSQDRPVVLSKDGRIESRAIGANGLFFQTDDNFIPNKDGIRLCAVDAAGNPLSNKSILLIHDGTDFFAQVIEGDYILGARGGNRLRLTDTALTPETSDAVSLGVIGETYTFVNLSFGVLFNDTKVVGARGDALPADATDLASALTLVNAIKARMKATGGHGLVED